MKAGKPGVAARQGGGFRQGFGHFDEEHLEQQATSSAVQQKQLTQQNTQSAQTPASAAAQHPGSQQSPARQPAPPREVSTVPDELVKRPFQDIIQGLKAIFSINDLLDIHPEDTPEEQQHKKELHERFGKLTEEQQEVAKKRYQMEMQQKKTEEEEKEKKKQAEEARKHQDVAMPSTPRKGPIGPGGPGGGKLSGKKMTEQLIERDRQSIGRVAGAN